MEHVVPCSLKLNLTLRITGRRDDGFHDLCSLFLALRGPETLTLRPGERDNVRDSIVVHNESIPGENIVEKTAKILRSFGVVLPPLEIHIWKQVPPGSGLGAGSGNAAGFVRWAERYTGNSITKEILMKLGADVPFLCRTSPLSLVSGVGEIQEDLPDRPDFKVLILFPEWSSPTPRAYGLLDDYHRSSGWPKDGTQARDEALDILRKLNRRQRVGLLPNDFEPVLVDQFPQYEMFFRASEASGALGYGITGSGSACFALFDTSKDMKDLSASCQDWAWGKKILALE